VLPAPFLQSRASFNYYVGGTDVDSVAPDGQNGVWLTVRSTQVAPVNGAGTYFYHDTDRVPAPLFGDVPHPIRERISAIAGAPDGELWAGTTEGSVYRYERLTGWARLRIQGWDPGKLVTNPTGVAAAAVGADGEGVAVGKGGRIADLSPSAV